MAGAAKRLAGGEQREVAGLGDGGGRLVPAGTGQPWGWLRDDSSIGTFPHEIGRAIRPVACRRVSHKFKLNKAPQPNAAEKHGFFRVVPPRVSSLADPSPLGGGWQVPDWPKKKK